MQFASDNWSGASEKIITALAAAARSGGPAYGGDGLTRSATALFCDLLEREVAVLFVGTGTAANTLALASAARPAGLIFCHAEAHINVDEAGAAELAGGKIVTVAARQGKILPEALAEALARFPPGALHHGQPAILSLTELTEFGGAYTASEIRTLADIAHGRGMSVHMDGARFANAVAAAEAAPADLTWRAGVDVLSFGGTKNGCVAAEGVVFFDAAKAADAAFLRQRAGQGYSKNWFVAAQFEAYLKDDHWLSLAGHANRAAAALTDAIRASRRARLVFEPAGNEVFAILAADLEAELMAAGAAFHRWNTDSLPEMARPKKEEVLVRLVTSWQTAREETDRFAALLAASPRT